jgi:hypothetical protein
MHSGDKVGWPPGALAGALPRRETRVTSLRFGQLAPGFSLPSTLGRPASLEEFRGQDVVLVFYCYDFGGI